MMRSYAVLTLALAVSCKHPARTEGSGNRATASSSPSVGDHAAVAGPAAWDSTTILRGRGYTIIVPRSARPGMVEVVDTSLVDFPECRYECQLMIELMTDTLHRGVEAFARWYLRADSALNRSDAPAYLGTLRRVRVGPDTGILASVPCDFLRTCASLFLKRGDTAAEVSYAIDHREAAIPHLAERLLVVMQSFRWTQRPRRRAA